MQVQRVLQLRIEEHAKYLEKMLEDQRKAGRLICSSSSQTLLSPSDDDSIPDSQNMSKTEVSAKKKASETGDDECESPGKRRKLENGAVSDDPKR